MSFVNPPDLACTTMICHHEACPAQSADQGLPKCSESCSSTPGYDGARGNAENLSRPRAINGKYKSSSDVETRVPSKVSTAKMMVNAASGSLCLFTELTATIELALSKGTLELSWPVVIA